MTIIEENPRQVNLDFQIWEVPPLKQILCMASEPWSSSLPGRTQQLISRLRDAQVLYFSPARSPKDRSFLQKGRQVRPNVTVCTLPPVPFPVSERHRFLFGLAWNRVSRFIQDTAARKGFSEPLLWTTHPRHIHLLDRLEFGALVYDCDKAWDGLPPTGRGAWPRRPTWSLPPPPNWPTGCPLAAPTSLCCPTASTSPCSSPPIPGTTLSPA